MGKLGNLFFNFSATGVAYVEENEVQNAAHAHSQAMAVQQQQQPVAVVTEILQPAPGTVCI